MKKIVYTFLFLSITALNIYAQQGWFWQNPLPQGNALGYVNFWGNDGLIIGQGSTILKTSNNGLNWNLYNVPAYNIVYQTFVFDQNNFLIAADNNLLKKTTNGGVSWITSEYVSGVTPLLFFINLNTGYSVVKTVFNSSLVLYKTTNGGNNWSLNITDTSSRIYSIYFPNESTGYLAGSRSNSALYTKLLKTTNGGSTWDSINTNTRFSANNLYFFNGLTGFINTHSGWIYKTTDGAASWDSIAHTGSTGKFYFINSNTGFVTGLYNTYKTTNSGTSWTTLSIPSGNFFYDGTNTYTATGDYGSIYRSTNNGFNWFSINQTVHTGFCNKIEAVDENFAYVGGENSTILKTINGGANWSSLQNTQMEYIQTLYFINSMTGFIGGLANGNYGNIQKTTNGGLNWINTNSNGIFQVFDLSFPNIQTGYAATKYGLFAKTTDSGLNWFTLGPFDYFSTGGLFFTDVNTGFWAGASNISNKHIRKTTNGGLNWQETEVENIYSLFDIKFIDQNTGFACGYFQDSSGTNYDGLILKTIDGGSTWNRTNFNNSGEFHEISVVQDFVYISGSYGKIIKSTNRGLNWEIQQSCYSNYIESIDFINQNTGYACSYGGIIIKTTTGGEPIGIEPISNTIPNDFRLYQNYPNPFNPVTKIKFSIPVSSQSEDVNIHIYDVTGREVRNYPLGNLKAGIYSIDFDGTGLASGVYFCRLISGKFNLTNKMVLIK